MRRVVAVDSLSGANLCESSHGVGSRTPAGVQMVRSQRQKFPSTRAHGYVQGRLGKIQGGAVGGFGKEDGSDRSNWYVLVTEA